MDPIQTDIDKREKNGVKTSLTTLMRKTRL